MEPQDKDKSIYLTTHFREFLNFFFYFTKIDKKTIYIERELIDIYIIQLTSLIVEIKTMYTPSNIYMLFIIYVDLV